MLKITLKLVKGLGYYQVDDAFSENNMMPLLNFSCNRMLGHMQNAVSQKEDFLSFLNCISLIHEEVATILAIVEPYKKATFNQSMHEIIAQNANFKHVIEPVYYCKNSGMSCCQSALNAAEFRKSGGSDGMSPVLKIGLGKNNYHENGFLLHFGELHDVFEFSDDLLSAIEIDAYFGNFHPSFSLKASVYKPSEIISDVEKLFTEKMVSNHVLVVIDSTIGMTDDGKLEEFISHNKDRINNKEMSVVNLRSLQKMISPAWICMEVA
ncbi:MAG: hypothetical protein HC848_05610 [Limnobacter sp.]|nr:hypothetical protein [Limnobacter sp.]